MVGASFTVAAAAEVLRSKKGISAVGNAQISTAQSKFGGASSLYDGNGDYLTIPNSSDFNYTGNYTIEGWWYQPSNVAADIYPTLIGTGAVSDNKGWAVTSEPTTNKINFITSGDGSSGMQVLLSSASLSAATWNHWAVVRSSSVLTVYINGTASGSTYTTTGNSIASTYPLYIGGGVGGLSSGNFSSNSATVVNLNGYLDEIRISNTARYTTTFTSSTTPFVNDANTLLLIHANGTNASTFFEDDNGTGRSQVGITAVGNAQIDTAQNKFGGASALFDGSGDRLIANSIPELGNDLTIEFWYRHNSFGGQAHFVDARLASDGSVNKPTLFRTTSSTLDLFYAGNVVISGAWTPTSGVWYHIALVRSSGIVRIYVGGTQLGSNWSNSQTWDGSDYSIGDYAGGGFGINGHIDEFRISNSARYTAGFTAPTSPFVNDANTLLLIHMDQADGATLFRDDNTGTVTTEDSYTVPAAAFTSDALTVALWHLDNALTDSSSNAFTFNTSGGFSSGEKQFGSHSGNLTDSTSDFFAHTTDRQFAPYNGSIMTDLTWECWVYYTSFSGASFNHASQNNPHPTLLCAGDQAGNRQSLKFGFSGSEGPYASGLLCFAAGDLLNGNIDTHTARGTTSYSLNTWYHIALTYNSLTGNVKGYVNGVKEFTKQAPNLGYSLPTHFTIGAMQSNNSACYVDEVRISRMIRYGI
jgi:hypothetical protein